jgi:hypothetical protein
MVQGLSLKFAAGYHVAVWLAKEYKVRPSCSMRVVGTAFMNSNAKQEGNRWSICCPLIIDKYAALFYVLAFSA